MSTAEALKTEVLEHAPADLVWDHCLAAFTKQLDVSVLAASRLHKRPNVFRTREAFPGRPAWV